MKKEIIIPAVILLLVGSFYSGMQYGKNQVTSAASQQGGRTRVGAGNGTGTGGGARGFGAGGGAVNGTVLSLSNNSLTVKLRDGSSRIVFFSSSTSIGKQTAGLIADINTGSDITVMGSANADGSVTAQNIQLRPASSTRPF